MSTYEIREATSKVATTLADVEVLLSRDVKVPDEIVALADATAKLLSLMEAEDEA